jgi:dCMP deaminase
MFTKKKKNKIVAIVGLTGAGKTVSAKYLESKGFSYLRFGQITLDILKKKIGKKNNPELEKQIREDIRKKHGMAAYAVMNKPKLDKLLKKTSVVVDGLYSWSEYKYLKKVFGNKLIVLAISTKPSIRYDRLEKRTQIDSKMINRPMTKLESIKRDHAEIENIEKGGPIAIADITITNNETIDSLYSKLDKFLKPKSKRPKWDEYFLEIMNTVAKRATCGRGRSGCVIVKNNHILTTGYVGSPPGLSHCDEVGHLMIKSTQENDSSEQLHDHCVRTIHAEQNAIVQAAKIGVSLIGATLYCRMEPCPVCARMIIAVGIKKVVCQKRYKTASLTRQMFKQVGIELVVISSKLQDYE